LEDARTNTSEKKSVTVLVLMVDPYYRR